VSRSSNFVCFSSFFSRSAIIVCKGLDRASICDYTYESNFSSRCGNRTNYVLLGSMGKIADNSTAPTCFCIDVGNFLCFFYKFAIDDGESVLEKNVFFSACPSDCFGDFSRQQLLNPCRSLRLRDDKNKPICTQHTLLPFSSLEERKKKTLLQ
jgi:hypothetical protein